MCNAAESTFPKTFIMGSTRWITFQFYSFSYECLSKHLLVPILDIQHECFLTSRNFCPYYGSNNAKNATMGAKSSNFHHATTGIHFGTSTYTARVVRQLLRTFFSKMIHRYKEGFNVIAVRCFLKERPSRDSFANIGVSVLALCLQQTMYLETLVSRAVLNFTTANCCCINARKRSTP